MQDIFRLHELQFHVGSLTDSAADTDPVVVKEVIFVLHTGLHRGQSAGGVPVGLNDVLLKLAHLRRVVFDADWDEAAEETAFSSFSPSLRAKAETAEGGARSVRRARSRLHVRPQLRHGPGDPRLPGLSSDLCKSFSQVDTRRQDL